MSVKIDNHCPIITETENNSKIKSNEIKLQLKRTNYVKKDISHDFEL